MNKLLTLSLMSLSLVACAPSAEKASDVAGIGRTSEFADSSNCFTPEVMWKMGRIGGYHLSPEAQKSVYGVTYYSVEKNRSRSVIYASAPSADSEPTMLTASSSSEYSPSFLPCTDKIVFLAPDGNGSGTMQLWSMNTDGTDRKQISSEANGVDDYLFSPCGNKVILIETVAHEASVQKNDEDLSLSTGIVANDLMYKHWDHYTKSAPHPFVADFDGNTVSGSIDLLEGEPYESPMLPFGGAEQLAWSPDGKQIAYTCRKLSGIDYAISTDSDIFLYDLESGETKNLCKPEGYVRPACDPTRSLKHQAVNQFQEDVNAGYDQNPQFSPDGKFIAWSSMERDGYESDRTRLCIYEFATGKKTYVTESFESGVNEFAWASDNNTLYFSGVWHGKTNLYSTNLQGEVKQITNEEADFVLLGIHPNGEQLLAKRHSMTRPDEVFFVGIADGKAEQITHENDPFYAHFQFGKVVERWIETTDKKQMHAWVILPPNFDETKKYPTLLFCEGGPQSPVSQFWSYRWNFQVMASQGYVVIAPNRRGLPGFGMEWLEQISGDYSGQCMQDYLSAIDDIAKEPWVDTERLGAVGASFGGYSVYWLAGNHEKRFKAFIAHDGIFNTQQQYMETEEMWFPNWDMGQAPWYKDAQGKRAKVFETSPHLYVDRWDTPILCIHGQKDFRIEYTQAESAFTAARVRGIPAQLLLFPDENHWVLKPQNGILWQRTFFRWLDKWLKK
ncbi:MAG: S9 family peptidase [Bacteroidaceae bacterium]|nr:S9 family peptidase [Bacteroidaceae bacterium]